MCGVEKSAVECYYLLATINQRIASMKTSLNPIVMLKLWLVVGWLPFLVHAHDGPEHIIGSKHKRGHSRPHRRLEPRANIANVIEEEIANGNMHPRFTLTAALEGSASFDTPKTFEVDVVLTDPSVNNATTFSVDGGESNAISSNTKLLIADNHDGSARNFAILEVNEELGTVKGIVQKDNKLVKWIQDVGGAAVVSETNFDPPKDWTCYVKDRSKHESSKRGLEEFHDDHDHDGHSHDFGDNIMDIAKHLGLGTAKTQSHRGLYATDDFPNQYSYQVDLYVEVDTAMVTNHDPTDSVNMPNTIAYVNALITAVSSIYEQEIDTKCKSIHAEIFFILERPKHVVFVMIK